MKTKVFLSYRRDDSALFTGRLYDRLASAYGGDAVFTDIDSIPLASDFRQVVASEIGKCRVFVAVIGPRWENGAEEHSRIADPDDYVRIEISEAIRQKKTIIPVYFDGRQCLTHEQLPTELTKLCYCNACEIDGGKGFTSGVSNLTRSIDHLLFASWFHRVWHRTRLYLRRNRVLLSFVMTGCGLIGIFHNGAGRILLDRNGLPVELVEDEPNIFATSKTGLREMARVFSNRNELSSDSNLDESMFEARRRFDVFAINGAAFLSRVDMLDASLRRGVKWRFVLLEHSILNNAAVTKWFRDLDASLEQRKLSQTNQVRSIGVIEMLQRQCREQPDKYPGSIEVRWWKREFHNGLWVRDSDDAQNRIGHIEITFHGNLRMNPSVRCGRCGPAMVGAIQSQFDQIWADASTEGPPEPPP